MVMATFKVARFVDNNDGTVTDTKTGLVWKKDTAPGTFTWEKAVKYCGEMGDGWRLPIIEELISIVDYSRLDPAIDPVFSNAQSSLYWSSTTYAGSPDGAWYVGFGVGGVGYRSKSGRNSVRAVRAGQ
jgi:hypothetical protein